MGTVASMVGYPAVTKETKAGLPYSAECSEKRQRRRLKGANTSAFADSKTLRNSAAMVGK